MGLALSFVAVAFMLRSQRGSVEGRRGAKLKRCKAESKRRIEINVRRSSPSVRSALALPLPTSRVARAGRRRQTNAKGGQLQLSEAARAEEAFRPLMSFSLPHQTQSAPRAGPSQPALHHRDSPSPQHEPVEEHLRRTNQSAAQPTLQPGSPRLALLARRCRTSVSPRPRGISPYQT